MTTVRLEPINDGPHATHARTVMTGHHFGATNKAAFDLALRPDLRAALDPALAAFRSQETRTIAHLEDELPHLQRTPAGACPLCGNEAHISFSVRSLDHARCPACGFVFTLQIAPSAADRARYRRDETAAMRLALVQHPAWRALEHERAHYIFSRLEDCAGRPSRVLDIGAGSGAVLTAAREAGIAAEGVEINAAYAAAHAEAGLKVHYGAFPDDFTPERLGRFDAIALLDVLEHMADPVAFLSEVARYLNEGGLIAIQTPNFDSLLLQIEGPANHNFCSGHWNHFTPKTLARAARAAGLRPLLLDTYITELNRILAKPWPLVADAFCSLTGERLAAPEELTPERLYQRHLGYKAFAILGRAT